MRESEIFRSVCRSFDNETADLYRREWVRDGDRDRESLTPAGGGYPCHIFGRAPVKGGSAALTEMELDLLIDIDAPVRAGMKICVHRPDGREWYITCGTVDSCGAYKAVKVRLEQYV